MILRLYINKKVVLKPPPFLFELADGSELFLKKPFGTCKVETESAMLLIRRNSWRN